MNANAKRALDIGAGIATGVIGMFSLATFMNGQLLVATLLAIIAMLGLGWYVTVTYLQAVAADTPQTTYTQPRVATRLWLGKGALDEPKQEETWQ
jgi:hypothetical protein